MIEATPKQHAGRDMFKPKEGEEFTPRCQTCRYNLTGLTEQRCPECGNEFDLQDMRDRAQRGAPSIGRVLTELLLLPLLLSLPTLCCGLLVMVQTTPGFFVFLLGIVLVLLAYNGDRVRDKVSTCADDKQHRLLSFVARSNLMFLVFLQLTPLIVFWGVIITYLIKHPPRLFPF